MPEAAETRSQTAISSNEESELSSHTLGIESLVIDVVSFLGSISILVGKVSLACRLSKPIGRTWKVVMPGEENLASRTRWEMSLKKIDVQLINMDQTREPSLLNDQQTNSQGKEKERSQVGKVKQAQKRTKEGEKVIMKIF